MAGRGSKPTTNLYNIDTIVKVDPDQWANPLTRQAEAVRVIKQITDKANQLPTIDKLGRAQDAKWALILDDAARAADDSFPPDNRNGAIQHKDQMINLLLLIQHIFGPVYPDIYDIQPDWYDNDDDERHVYDAAGAIVERFPLVPYALKQILDCATLPASITNTHLRKLLKEDLKGPVQASAAAITKHDLCCDGILRFWRAASSDAAVKSTESERVQELLMYVGNTYPDIKIAYDIFVNQNKAESSFVTLLTNLKTFVKNAILEKMAASSGKQPADVSVHAVDAVPQGTCPVHPNGNHKAEECNVLKRMAQELHGPSPVHRPAPSGGTKSRHASGPHPSASRRPSKRPKTQAYAAQAQLPTSQTQLDPEGRYEGNNFDDAKWRAQHPQQHNETQVAQAMHAAFHVNALCVTPIPPVDRCIVVQEPQALNLADLIAWEIEAADKKLSTSDKPAEICDNADAAPSMPVLDNIMLVLDLVDSFNTYLARYVNKETSDTAIEFYIKRDKMLSDIHNFMQQGLPGTADAWTDLAAILPSDEDHIQEHDVFGPDSSSSISPDSSSSISKSDSSSGASELTSDAESVVDACQSASSVEISDAEV